MTQRYAARERFEWPNGAIGYGPGGPFDCIGPYARVTNCPIAGTALRLTCYATAPADTYFSVPACTRYRGRYVRGYFTGTKAGTIFCVMDSDRDAFPQLMGPRDDLSIYSQGA
jgi:hypothetical protein